MGGRFAGMAVSRGKFRDQNERLFFVHIAKIGKSGVFPL
jgi:hypothetical protein